MFESAFEYLPASSRGSTANAGAEKRVAAPTAAAAVWSAERRVSERCRVEERIGATATWRGTVCVGAKAAAVMVAMVSIGFVFCACVRDLREI